MMGDFNAKIGSDNTGREQSMGKHGLWEMNENGELFSDFCAFNNMVIGGSVYPHKRVHKVTWISPNHVTENQIDHICISRRFRRSLLDVRPRRGADAASDHHLVTGKFRFKLKTFNPAALKTSHRYNVELLRDPVTIAKYQLTLRNRYQPLADMQEEEEPFHDLQRAETVENIWQQIRDSWKENCEETLGKKTRQHKEWASVETVKKIEERKKRKNGLNRTREKVDTAKPTRLEIKKAIKQLKAGKAPGPDGVHPEAIKANLDTSTDMLYNLFGKIWDEEELPD
ncbi:hypothetical protein SKAU_G00382090 [Synaphobranchus kaupii]|uniref:Endonuclease/exonuclease/phosphatase domain-containing protein n=1 Tax=Synaphobranchus kaupii TaxID=118154 RepID=A0A9Q1IET0_SYNKA|nr:hypothetical protein SKAU_G00382090 [Synaphobranchus kaupii]